MGDRSTEVLSSRVFDAPVVGPLLVAASDAGVVAIRFVSGVSGDAARTELEAELGCRVEDADHPGVHRARRQITAFLDGKRRGFRLALDLRGTPFQRRVWEVLLHIPFGETRSYGDVARAIGRPEASRAVAGACGRNHVPIVVPCHRVIAGDGGLGGFSAGLDRKRRLLSLERGSGALPLFELATRRVRETSRHERERSVAELLPRDLRERLDLAAEGIGPAALELGPDAWIEAALEAVGEKGAAALAAWVAARTRDPVLVSMLARRALDYSVSGHGPAEDVREALLAALSCPGAQFVALAWRLAKAEKLPRRVAAVVEAVVEEVLEGDLVPAETPHATRERLVDVWLELRRRAGDETWAADRSPDPSAVLAKAGLWREAAVAAEAALASGAGDRRALLLRLADAYEELDLLDMARDRLTALLAERENPALLARLRSIEDRIRSES